MRDFYFVGDRYLAGAPGLSFLACRASTLNLPGARSHLRCVEMGFSQRASGGLRIINRVDPSGVRWEDLQERVSLLFNGGIVVLFLTAHI